MKTNILFLLLVAQVNMHAMATENKTPTLTRFTFSAHAEDRSNQRFISDRAIQDALSYGKQIPSRDGAVKFSHNGTTVVANPVDKKIITTITSRSKEKLENIRNHANGVNQKGSKAKRNSSYPIIDAALKRHNNHSQFDKDTVKKDNKRALKENAKKKDLARKQSRDKK